MDNQVFSYDDAEMDNKVLNADSVKICQACGKPFVPEGRNGRRRKFCPRTHYVKCVICGKEFSVEVNTGNPIKKTCSRECNHKRSVKSMKESMLAKYGVENPSQLPDHQDKVRKTCLERYGAESYSNSEEGKAKAREIWKNKTPEELEERYQKSVKTCLERYGVDNGSRAPHAVEKQKATNLAKYGKEWYRQTEECNERIKATTKERYGDEVYFRTQDYRDKVRKTCIEKYGVDHFTRSQEYKHKMEQIWLERAGVKNALQLPESRKNARSHRNKFEQQICDLLGNYDIDYTCEHTVSKDDHSHTFDIFIPKYKILIDADGEYYHAYIEDPDGYRSRDDYDDVRVFCVPEDYIYIVIVESHLEQGLKELERTLQMIDTNVFDYDSELFEWCRSIDFPYYSYGETYLRKQFDSLVHHEFIDGKYNQYCKKGISLVNQFHPSIFDCTVQGSKSVKEAWYDDRLLKKVIANRLIYKNDVTPSKILSGFNISSVARRVTVFNPVLAKYLIQTYLSEYNEIFDPFSGFSGRLLGTLACNKKYTGYDIREISVEESNNILRFLGDNTSSVGVKDVFDNYGKYECLLTCPPYNMKEVYIDNQKDLSCDEWIDLCLDHFDCNRYVFVVDTTEKYKDNIVQHIFQPSHFAQASESVLVIDR